MRKSNLLLLPFALVPLLVSGCGNSGATSSSLDPDGYGVITTDTEKTASFAALKNDLETLGSAENQGWHYDEDSTLAKNEKDISFDLLTLTPKETSSNTSSLRASEKLESASSVAEKTEKTYSLSIDCESADAIINDASAPNIDYLGGYMNANKVYLYGLSEEESGAAGGGALYLPSTKGYLKGGTGYLDITKDASLKTAINAVVHSSFPGNDSWEVPDKIKKPLPSLSDWLSLSLTSDLPEIASNFVDNLQALEKEDKDEVVLYRKGTSYRTKIAIESFTPVFKAIDDVLEKQTLSGKLRGYLWSFKDAVTSFSLKGSLDYDANEFGSATLRLSFTTDKEKLKTSYPNANAFVTSFSMAGVFTPLLGESAVISYPDFTEFVVPPDIVQ